MVLTSQGNQLLVAKFDYMRRGCKKTNEDHLHPFQMELENQALLLLETCDRDKMPTKLLFFHSLTFFTSFALCLVLGQTHIFLNTL